MSAVGSDPSCALSYERIDVTGPRTDSELPELARHILAFEHDRARHDRTKEAEIRVEFDMSPARYYQVLNHVIDTEAALAFDPQLVTRLQRLRHARTSARAARTFGRADREGLSEQHD